MKRKYISPTMNLVLFETDRNIMDNVLPGGSGYDAPWEPESFRQGYSINGTPNGTVVNNNGAPTFVPGGNGGGGRQTPLG